MMIVNKYIYKELEQLDYLQKILFGLMNFKRVVGLYKIFDDDIKKNNLEPLNNSTNNFFILNQISDALLSNINQIEGDISKLKLDKKLCLEAAPSDEDYGCIETTLAQNIACLLATVIDYIITKKESCINEVSDYIIIIVDAIYGHIYSLNQNQNISLDEFTDSKLVEETNLQNKLIILLKKQASIVDLLSFSNANKVFFSET